MIHAMLAKAGVKVAVAVAGLIAFAAPLAFAMLADDDAGVTIAGAQGSQCRTPNVQDVGSVVPGPVDTPIVFTGPAPTSFTLGQFFTDTLTAMGVPPKPEAVVFGVAWMLNEGGHYNGALYNPLNTTKKMPGSTLAMLHRPGGPSHPSSAGVQTYPDYKTGIEATALTLRLPYYTDIVASLRVGASADSIVTALKESPWDAAHYANVNFAPLIARARTIVSGTAPGPSGAPADNGSTSATGCPQDVSATSPGSGGISAVPINVSDPLIRQVILNAEELIGVPYVWGGTSASGADCSGMVVYAWRKAGRPLAVRTASQMWHHSTPLAWDQLQPGDLIFEEFGVRDVGHVVMSVDPVHHIVMEEPHTGAVGRLRVLAPGTEGAKPGRLNADAFQ